MRKAKTLYCKNEFIYLKGNLKQNWNEIKKFCNLSTNKKIVEYLSVNRANLRDKREFADHFNEYFCNIATTLSSKVPSIDVSPLQHVNVSQSLSLFLSAVTPNEIISHATTLKLTKYGESNFSALAFKFVIEYLSPVVAHLVIIVLNKVFSLLV